jgi:hypothetical protein
MTSLLFLTQKTICNRQIIFYIRIPKEYNLEIATKKTMVFGFFGTGHLKTKIIINDETLEQVSQFTYLGCSIQSEQKKKHSLISSSYKIKTYWNIFINMGLQIH